MPSLGRVGRLRASWAYKTSHLTLASPAFQARRKLLRSPCIMTLSVGTATRMASLRFRSNRRSWYCLRLVFVRIVARASSRAHLLNDSASFINLRGRLRRSCSGEDLMKNFPLLVTYVIPALSIRIPSLLQDTSRYVWMAKTWTSLWQPEQSGTKLRFRLSKGFPFL
jgi:hypothetical protein